MPINTNALKTFAQETRTKLISLIQTKMEYILTQDTAQLRGFETQIENLNREIASKGKDLVVEEVAYTWFNRVMALRFMDANGYTSLKVVTPGIGQMRPEILQEAMAGNIDETLRVKIDDNPSEAMLYRRLLVAICNNYGTSMPFLFEHISDYTEMLLPDDLLSNESFVTDIRNGMSDEDCQNVEVMGWLYQFYITDRKADAETKKSRRGGLKSDEQAAATQLFTPHWVVRYMVENSLGRIWMTLHPESRLIDEMPYYIPTPDGQADVIPEDIHSAADIRFIDPCMGSGHILVYAFDLFCKMYEEEGVHQEKEIPQLILSNNLFGIDIDRRCYQLAAFALTMKARAYYRRYLRKTVTPNVIALQTIDRNTIASAGEWSSRSAMWQFENIDTIGSLLQITPEECAAIKVENGLFGTGQQLLKTQAEYLSRKYHCVVTNPPYLGKGIGDALKNYAKLHFPYSKYDTMAIFMERCLELCPPQGKVSMINMHSWMFIASYTTLRTKLLRNYAIDSLLHLGMRTFDEIGGEVVQSVAFTLANHIPYGTARYYRLVDAANSYDKEQAFLRRENEYNGVNQNNFFQIPESPLAYWANNTIYRAFQNSPSLGSLSTVKIGMGTGKNEIFLRNWWEISTEKIDRSLTNISQLDKSSAKYFPYNKGGKFRKWYGNIIHLLWFDKKGRDFMGTMSGHRENGGYQHYCQQGITWSFVGTGTIGVRFVPTGCFFDVAGSTMFASEDRLKYILGFLSTKACNTIQKVLNPTVNFQAGNMKNLPLIIENEEIINNLVTGNISISELDWDMHEFSMDFKVNGLLRIAKNHLFIGDLVKIFKDDWSEKFHQLHHNEEELNRQFIEIYGLQDELTPNVPLEEITILQKGEISIEDGEIIWHDDVIIKQLISYLVGCFMGRYSIEHPGLIIASQHQDLNELGLKIDGLDNDAQGRIAIDDDGIVPILKGEYFPDDMTVRIEQAIKVIFGEENFQQNLRYINEKLGKSLREYLFKDFFADHIDGKMYQKRPIYWLFSSKMGDRKKKGYFKALVYMHRIESDTLSKLHADYVVPYITRIEQELQEVEENAVRDDLTSAQRNRTNKLVTELRDQLYELREYATILAEMSTQRISIDLDDGVKVNYPKFYPLVEPIKGLDKED